MMCELYSLLSLNCIYYLYVSVGIVPTSLTMTWKASKACPGHYVLDLLCALCSHHLILAPPSRPRAASRGNHLKNQRFTIWWCVGYIHSRLSVVSITYTISVGIVPTSLTRHEKRQKHVRSLFFWFFSVHVLTPSDLALPVPSTCYI